MKYFTKEELEDITKELIENPTRETLKNLNDKYNGNEEHNTLVKEMPVMETPIVEAVNEIKPPSEPVVPPVEVSVPVENELPTNPIPNIPNIENSPMNDNVNVSNQQIPSFELPKLDTPTNAVQNNAPINFTGNIFDNQPQMANLMQTTDNFNSVPNTMPTTEVPVTGTPFFGPHMSQENNSIPVGGTMNNTQMTQPTMFGQLEQNYM